MTTTAGLFGSDPAAVIGLPSAFDVRREMRQAREIRLATAFAHQSGWRLIKDAVTASKADCVLIAGRSFSRSEPAVLRNWLRLSRSARVRTYLFAPARGVFHPKVLYVTNADGRRDFAIVGSGNLSGGGLRTNVECGLFTREESTLATLSAWFSELVAERGACVPLTASLIDGYELDHKRAKAADRTARKKSAASSRRMREKHQAKLKTWDGAVRDARRYLRTYQSEFRKRYLFAVREMKTALNYPMFDFDEDGWNAFYSVPQLGRLVAIGRPRVWREHARFQPLLRQLIDESIPIEDRVDGLLRPEGGARIKGLGINTVSKILTIHYPKRWPVLNGIVKRVLDNWGYEEPWGGSPGQKYRAYADLIRSFRKECGARDLLDVDAYLYDTGSELA